jgi:hypothetical protein
MPVILPEEDHAKWLGEVEDGNLKALLKPFQADQMRIWATSPRVNSPENNDPEVIVPIPDNMSDWKLAGSEPRETNPKFENENSEEFNSATAGVN